MVQVPSENVTVVRPSELELDMLVEPVPGPACDDTEGPAPVVKPDTLPLPAVTDDARPPAAADVFGGVSPGFKCTVLQLALGPDDEEDVLPSEDDALDELELSAWAAMAITLASAAAQNIGFFIRNSPGQATGRPAGRPVG